MLGIATSGCGLAKIVIRATSLSNNRAVRLLVT
jgi:hypothetical protein